MKNVTPRSTRISRSYLIRGIALMLAGSYLLISNLGFSLPFALWHFLPVPFVVAGVWGLSFPNRHLNRAGGAWSLGIGVYLACGFFNVFGLGWGTAWPVFIIGLGLAIILGRDHGNAPPVTR
jgi:hypothetical protein